VGMRCTILPPIKSALPGVRARSGRVARAGAGGDAALMPGPLTPDRFHSAHKGRSTLLRGRLGRRRATRRSCRIAPPAATDRLNKENSIPYFPRTYGTKRAVREKKGIIQGSTRDSKDREFAKTIWGETRSGDFQAFSDRRIEKPLSIKHKVLRHFMGPAIGPTFGRDSRGATFPASRRGRPV
jgi:hypothetical protein